MPTFWPAGRFCRIVAMMGLKAPLAKRKRWIGMPTPASFAAAGAGIRAGARADRRGRREIIRAQRAPTGAVA
ncbi:MAG: hypothetical protein BroJett031_14040 [Betaproteobacteria bacterium]|nr:MAG: hypothetical protein BroJett031_14040 [Betaproteobacteria bacterium]